MSTREISAGAHSRPLASHNGRDTQPVFKTWVSEPVIASFGDADLPNPIEHFLIVLSAYLLFLVTAFAVAGAAFLLFFCRF